MQQAIWKVKLFLFSSLFPYCSSEMNEWIWGILNKVSHCLMSVLFYFILPGKCTVEVSRMISVVVTFVWRAATNRKERNNRINWTKQNKQPCKFWLRGITVGKAAVIREVGSSLVGRELRAWSQLLAHTMALPLSSYVPLTFFITVGPT